MSQTIPQNDSLLPSLFPTFFNPGNDLGDIVVMDLAIIMFVAAIMIAIAHKLKQPMVIGYIIAGMIIGPYTPPFQLVGSIETVNLLAELGIIMPAVCSRNRIPNSQTQVCWKEGTRYCLV